MLCAGFPCQSFSKSGYQRGVEEARGTLFYDICRVIEAKAPQYLLLENVMNFVGRRHRDTWATMICLLRELGYAVSTDPTVLSPHQLPPSSGGSPQTRERVFIPAIRVGPELAFAYSDLPPLVDRRPMPWWSPNDWNVVEFLGIGKPDHHLPPDVGGERERAANLWNKLLPDLGPIAGYPLWADVWLGNLRVAGASRLEELPDRSQSEAYRANRGAIKSWLARFEIDGLYFSYRKLEWHAKDGVRDIWCHAIQFRPSGIRVSPLTYLPALVAIAQTPIIGPVRRRISPSEAAQLQGFPPNFPLPSLGPAYRLIGNAVHVGTTRFVCRTLVLEDAGTRGGAMPASWREVRAASTVRAA